MIKYRAREVVEAVVWEGGESEYGTLGPESLTGFAQLRLHEPRRHRYYLQRGDCIVRHADGTLEAMTKEAFEERFERDGDR